MTSYPLLKWNKVSIENRDRTGIEQDHKDPSQYINLLEHCTRLIPKMIRVMMEKQLTRINLSIICAITITKTKVQNRNYKQFYNFLLYKPGYRDELDDGTRAVRNLMMIIPTIPIIMIKIRSRPFNFRSLTWTTMSSGIYGYTARLPCTSNTTLLHSNCTST